MQRPTLYISHDTDSDWLSAIEFGRVDDGVAPARWRPVSQHAAWLLDAPRGREVGFRVVDVSKLDLAGDDFAEFWETDGPRFDAPTMGLVDVTAGEVLLAAWSTHEYSPTLNRFYFNEAMATTGLEALAKWQLCLETGDQMAHYGLGYTHYELGNHHVAYGHLRHYVTLAEAEPWAWCWLGKAAFAIGETDEAAKAWQRAVALELGGDGETEAQELLGELRRRGQ